jgi:hypothetical protein
MRIGREQQQCAARCGDEGRPYDRFLRLRDERQRSEDQLK